MNYLIMELKKIQGFALENQTCKRKAVGCSIVELSLTTDVTIEGSLRTEQTLVMAHNGPSGSQNSCSNEVGNCGCSHAEPRAILNVLKRSCGRHLVMVCTYSPCTNCANIIIDSGIVDLVVYEELTLHDTRGRNFLLKSGIEVLTKHNLRWPTKEHYDIITRIRETRYNSV